MTHHPITASLVGMLLALAPVSAVAQDPPGARVTLGLGAGIAPDYFGSGNLGVGPVGAFSIQGLVLPGGFGIGSESALPTEPGSGLRGAFRYVPSRTASDTADLRGLEDVDAAVELGFGLFRITERLRVYGEIRRGFGGHEGWVAEAGVDAILRNTGPFILSAGPRVHWGDGAFLDSYYGVTPAEATRTGYATFSPDGGLVSVGVEMNARYDFGSGWGLHGTLGWRQLQGDAAGSPITQAGNREQVGARLILTRSFALRF